MKEAPQSSIPKADSSWSVAIIYSAWYPELVGPMVADAKKTLMESGIEEKNITMHEAPGSFEIPLLGAVVAEAGSADAIIALGIVVNGETHHARLIAEQAARGAMDVQLKYLMPFAFEILYVDTIELAKARSDKGKAAAITTLHSLQELQRITE